MGVKVFPSIPTCWHHNDKISQKYLLESLDAPVIPTYVFYDCQEALAWIRKASFPKVLKLREGSGGQHVWLLKTRDEARIMCQKAFGTGFYALEGGCRKMIKKTRPAKVVVDMCRTVYQTLKTFYISDNGIDGFPMRADYLYLQDYLQGNEGDTRISVIGNRAFGFRRLGSSENFRAGGKKVVYDPSLIDRECIKIALAISRKGKFQSMAYDFLFDQEQGRPLICEISCVFGREAAQRCPGYWDSDLNWIDGPLCCEEAIISDFLETLGMP
ncbi:MAG: hypothetical protein PHN49_04065 [Candidatus Omnitrophica bacterium]|nr:hypothetical protein [Candidatus Omnitrophota bacterium]MDD5670796.1 hypothetical protein [Candidatus Omnitrophota bacterium]